MVAMTAATIATILRDRRGSGRIDDIVDRLARISHSQIAAAAGNVTMVALGALAFTALWETTFGHAFLDRETAERTYSSFSPVTSGTVFFAALTGVVLWLSAVAGGWLDNWSAWWRIPQGIADHSLGARLGRERMRRWGGIWQRHIGFWGSNISLGLMLGMIPSLGHFLGAPLDVRHVTLSTGMLFTACGSLPDGWYSSAWFLLAVSGILTMFVLNLGVSFTLSLWTALRALEVPADDVHKLLRGVGARVMARPLDFILPAKGTTTDDASAAIGEAAAVQPTQAPC
jgi:site-specific recombinase